MASTCAESINQINGISAVERQKMVVACETTKLNESLPPFTEKATVPETVEKVTDTLNKETLEQISVIAKTAGQTVREVAKELNVAVNEFIQTPVGMLTAGLAIWYVAGDTIEGVFQGVWEVFGGITLILIATLFYNRFLSYALVESVDTKTVKGWFGSEKEVYVVTYRSWKALAFGRGDEAVVLGAFAWLASVITGLASIF